MLLASCTRLVANSRIHVRQEPLIHLQSPFQALIMNTHLHPFSPSNHKLDVKVVKTSLDLPIQPTENLQESSYYSD